MKMKIIKYAVINQETNERIGMIMTHSDRQIKKNDVEMICFDRLTGKSKNMLCRLSFAMKDLQGVENLNLETSMYKTPLEYTVYCEKSGDSWSGIRVIQAIDSHRALDLFKEKLLSLKNNADNVRAYDSLSMLSYIDDFVCLFDKTNKKALPSMPENAVIYTKKYGLVKLLHIGEEKSGMREVKFIRYTTDWNSVIEREMNGELEDKEYTLYGVIGKEE